MTSNETTRRRSRSRQPETGRDRSSSRNGQKLRTPSTAVSSSKNNLGQGLWTANGGDMSSDMSLTKQDHLEPTRQRLWDAEDEKVLEPIEGSRRPRRFTQRGRSISFDSDSQAFSKNTCQLRSISGDGPQAGSRSLPRRSVSSSTHSRTTSQMGLLTTSNSGLAADPKRSLPRRSVSSSMHSRTLGTVADFLDTKHRPTRRTSSGNAPLRRTSSGSGSRKKLASKKAPIRRCVSDTSEFSGESNSKRMSRRTHSGGRLIEEIKRTRIPRRTISGGRLIDELASQRNATWDTESGRSTRRSIHQRTSAGRMSALLDMPQRHVRRTQSGEGMDPRRNESRRATEEVKSRQRSRSRRSINANRRKSPDSVAAPRKSILELIDDNDISALSEIEAEICGDLGLLDKGTDKDLNKKSKKSDGQAQERQRKIVENVSVAMEESDSDLISMEDSTSSKSWLKSQATNLRKSILAVNLHELTSKTKSSEGSKREERCGELFDFDDSSTEEDDDEEYGMMSNGVEKYFTTSSAKEHIQYLATLAGKNLRRDRRSLLTRQKQTFKSLLPEEDELESSSSMGHSSQLYSMRRPGAKDVAATAA